MTENSHLFALQLSRILLFPSTTVTILKHILRLSAKHSSLKDLRSQRNKEVQLTPFSFTKLKIL